VEYEADAAQNEKDEGEKLGEVRFQLWDRHGSISCYQRYTGASANSKAAAGRR
jgi:hypothetical protein